MHNITLIVGDGIGKEITKSAMAVIDSTGVKIEYDILVAGEEALLKCGNPLPDDVIDSIKKNKVAIKGPVTTQIGKGFKSVNVGLRQKLDLFANIRPVKSIPGVKAINDNVDIVIFRENTEDLYAGIEEVVSEDEVHAIKVITRKASRNIARAAFEYAKKNNRKKVTAIHKANIMKLSDGLFIEEIRNVSKDYADIKYDEMIVDNACMKLVQSPEMFDCIVTENLYGDIISDLCAGLVGGLGVVPGMNIGDEYAVFEAVHGSAPDIAGKNIANPIAIILSSVEMLKYIGEADAADLIEKAVFKLLSDGKVLTPDLGGTSNTDELTAELCNIINTLK